MVPYMGAPICLGAPVCMGAPVCVGTLCIWEPYMYGSSICMGAPYVWEPYMYETAMLSMSLPTGRVIACSFGTHQNWAARHQIEATFMEEDTR